MRVIHSSLTDEWETPQALFDLLDKEFHFVVDVCATKANRKCETYFGPDHELSALYDGLAQDWMRIPGWCWLNPPYSETKMWLEKASLERRVVALIGARTDTRWWWDYVVKQATTIRFLKGRVTFGGAHNSAPFPSAIVEYWDTPVTWKHPKVSWWDWKAEALSQYLSTNPAVRILSASKEAA